MIINRKILNLPLRRGRTIQGRQFAGSKFAFLIIAILVVICCTGAKATESSFYDLLAQQKVQLPLQMRDAWFLTDIDVNDTTITRHYINQRMEFGKMGRAYGKRFTSMITAEIFEQCGAFRTIIYSQGITLVHHLADSSGNIFAVIVVDADRCNGFWPSHKGSR